MRITIFFDSFLAPLNNEKSERIEYSLQRRASVKDIIEALGVPHTEVGDLHLPERWVDWGYIPEKEDSLWVKSITPPFDVTRPDYLHPVPLPCLAFICDVNVGKLAILLRMIGVDVLMGNEWDDAQIAAFAEKERRVVLSKDSGLLKRNQVEFGRLIRCKDPDGQLKEVVDFFGLRPGPFFTRCLRCNRILAPVDKAEIEHRLLPKTKKYFHHFYLCPGCDRIYWAGSHMEKMRQRLRAIGIEPPSVEHSC